jgi:hypothetical protein
MSCATAVPWNHDVDDSRFRQSENVRPKPRYYPGLNFVELRERVCRDTKGQLQRLCRIGAGYPSSFGIREPDEMIRASPFTTVDTDWRPDEQGCFRAILALEVERDGGFANRVRPYDIEAYLCRSQNRPGRRFETFLGFFGEFLVGASNIVITDRDRASSKLDRTSVSDSLLNSSANGIHCVSL